MQDCVFLLVHDHIETVKQPVQNLHHILRDDQSPLFNLRQQRYNSVSGILLSALHFSIPLSSACNAHRKPL